MATKTNQDVAALWVEGLRGDWSILEALSSPTMRIWHSHDDQWLTREEGAARMAATDTPSPPPSFADVRALATADGFVVQGRMDGLAGGARTHIVQICTVQDGQVASCEEYIAPEMTIG